MATSVSLPGYIEIYDGAALSAGSIDMPNPGQISVYGNSTITSPALSNSTGTLYAGVGATARLRDNPVQLQNGNLSGGNWIVDDTGVLIFPSDISQITTLAGAAYGTVLDVQGRGSVQDASGNTPLATLTSVGSSSVLAVPSLTLDHDLITAGDQCRDTDDPRYAHGGVERLGGKHLADGHRSRCSSEDSSGEEPSRARSRTMAP